MQTENNIFTALQIARALKRSKRGVLLSLKGLTASGQIEIKGQLTQAWNFSALPIATQQELERAAQRSGFRNVEQLLSNSQPKAAQEISLAQVSQEALNKAAKLQRALARALGLKSNVTLSATELERIGLEDYRRVFGHSISSRHLRGLIKRTVDRDAGEENFAMLALYLDKNPSRKVLAKIPVSLDVETQFGALLHTLAACKNQATPSANEKALIWLRAFELYEEKISDGKAAKKTKRSLVKFLFRHVPTLAESFDALRVNFQRKYDRWINSERAPLALSDNRNEKSGWHRAPAFSDEDRDKLIAHAVLNCGGRLAQAWRELIERNALSEDLLGYYRANPSSKSYVPSRLAESVRHEIDMMNDIHHGPRTDKLNGAHLFRDWSGVASMDWFCADDATLEVYYYVQDGKGWFTLMRGQFLMLIDVRSTRILGFALQSETSYNARVIRTLITKVCDDHGLPRKGFYFEGGVWKNSRILKGDANADPNSLVETELGLRQLGLKFVHSRLPRSKPIERVIGAFQDLMDGDPGFVGGNEMKEKFERVQKQKLLVGSGKEHPAKFFYSEQQWEARLTELCETYNRAAQNGKMTEGFSPDDAFEKFDRADDPPIKLSPQCRYLLANHKRPILVTSNGITLRFGKQVYNYRNEETGHLRGQTVLAWFDPELPEILTVTDMNRENVFSIARTQEVPAMDASPELLSQENSRIQDHLKFARVRYRTLTAKHGRKFRQNFIERNTAELGAEIQAQQTALNERLKAEEQQGSKARKVYRRLKMAIPTNVVRRPEAIEAGNELNQFLNEEEIS